MLPPYLFHSGHRWNQSCMYMCNLQVSAYTWLRSGTLPWGIPFLHNIFHEICKCTSLHVVLFLNNSMLWLFNFINLSSIKWRIVSLSGRRNEIFYHSMSVKLKHFITASHLVKIRNFISVSQSHLRILPLWAQNEGCCLYESFKMKVVITMSQSKLGCYHCEPVNIIQLWSLGEVNTWF